LTVSVNGPIMRAHRGGNEVRAALRVACRRPHRLLLASPAEDERITHARPRHPV